jgi:trehalose 6-phosphate phosphatase
MKNILGPDQRAILGRFAKRRVLLAFDFDGTLAPIVRDPDAAAMRAATAQRLAEVARLYPCVVISGRALSDVRRKVATVPLRAVYGNHGMEPWSGLARARRLAAKWRTQLAYSLPPVPGVVIEDKGPSLAIHYRQARARTLLRRLILEVVADLQHSRVVDGKMVVNLLPADAPDKGIALLRVCRRLHCDSAIYLGDDHNDEDAFAIASKLPLLGIRVGRSPRSRARYFLSRQKDVDDLLARLLEERAGTARGRGAPGASPRPRAASNKSIRKRAR